MATETPNSEMLPPATSPTEADLERFRTWLSKLFGEKAVTEMLAPGDQKRTRQPRKKASRK
jgi:hypothetical protein